MRERILDRAVELFNRQGIEYVGVRELAKDLGVKAGNLTYYFPTKDDLVAAVGERLRALNDDTIRLPERPSLYEYLRMLRRAFENHYRFRCLFMSMPNLMVRNEKLARLYIGPVERGRREVLRRYLELLRDEGLLRGEVSDDELERVVGLLGLVTRGWIGDASLSFRDRSPEWCMAYYLAIVVDHLRPYVTEAGAAEVRRFEAEILPASR